MKIIKKIITSLAVAALAATAFLAPAANTQPAYATEKCTCANGQEGVPTSILGSNGCSCDDGTGSSIKDILNVVVQVMTIGIGILGAIGITIVGIQYITAGDNEERTRKAKRRLFEIVLGLFAYVVLYAALSWLIPDFHPFQWGN